MIIIGYQGIGKSTLAKHQLEEHGMSEYVDLESSCFWADGKRPDDWYVYYCQMAENLSKQGFKVFVSSHDVVRNQLKNSKEKVIVVCPDWSLEDFWIDRLKKRYDNEPTDKNYKAWQNSVTSYHKNISELLHSGYNVGLITKQEYDLDLIINFLEYN